MGSFLFNHIFLYTLHLIRDFSFIINNLFFSMHVNVKGTLEYGLIFFFRLEKLNNIK